MAISDKAKVYPKVVYERYGTGSGILFGIRADQRSYVEAIVQSVLDIVDEEHRDELRVNTLPRYLGGEKA